MWVRGLKPFVASITCSFVQSHPMWVRGLKRLRYVHTAPPFSRTPCGCVDWNASASSKWRHPPVAPHVGAWIETYLVSLLFLFKKSHPMWVRGLKQVDGAERQRRSPGRTPCGCVDWNRYFQLPVLSSFCRTPCGCVDWNRTNKQLEKAAGVAPHVGAWIETRCGPSCPASSASHPMWVRGLKQRQSRARKNLCASHPMWVRGLKLFKNLSMLPSSCRTPCGCVDWNRYSEIEEPFSWRRTPRGCVDWNFFCRNLSDLQTSRTQCGCVCLFEHHFNAVKTPFKRYFNRITFRQILLYLDMKALGKNIPLF